MDIKHYSVPAPTVHEEPGAAFLVEFSSGALEAIHDKMTDAMLREIQVFWGEGRLDLVLACYVLRTMEPDSMKRIISAITQSHE